MNKDIKNIIDGVNSVDELETLKTSINESIENRKEFIKLVEKANSLKGESFGFINETMENLFSNLLETKQGRKMIKRYINEIKNSKSLKPIYSFYDNVKNINENTNAELLVNEWKRSVGKIEKINENELKNLGTILAESFVWAANNDENIIPSDSRKEFYNIVEGVYNTKPSSKNMATYFNDISKMKEMVVENRKSLNDYYSAFSDNLKEEASNIAEGKDSFEKAKNECINKLTEAKKNFEEINDSNSKEKLELYIESVEKKEYNESTLNSDISNFKELITCFE